MLSLAQSGFANPLSFRRSKRRLLLVSSGNDPGPLIRRLSANGNSRFEVVRVIEPDRGGRGTDATHLAPEKLRRDRIWGIVVGSNSDGQLPTEPLLHCRLTGIRVFDESSFLERQARCIDIDSHDPRWLWTGEGFGGGQGEKIIRRALDLLVGTVGLILSLPLMLIVSGLIKLDSRGRVLYRQQRIGLKGRIFTLYKFRSMRADAEASGVPVWAAVGDPRVTRFGRLIRYTRLDELPQLLNVLRGDMSVVGPRPERPYFVEQLTAAIPFYSARHYVKPGITGWAQVNAPYGASVEDARQKLRYDLYYVKHRSLLLDFRILLRTLRIIILQQGAR